MKGNWLIVFALFLLYACGQNPAREQEEVIRSTDQDTTAELVNNMPEPSSSSSESTFPDESLLGLKYEKTDHGFEGQGWYKRLTGTIGNLPVTVHLVKKGMIRRLFDTRPGEMVYGYYYYDKYQEPIPLYQFHPDPDQEILQDKLVLYENYFDAREDQWRLTYNEDGSGYYEGSWHNGETGKAVAIYLEEVFPNGSERLEARWLSDIRKYPLAEGDTSAALLNLSLLMPDINSDWINGDIAYEMIWRIIPPFANADLAEQAGNVQDVLKGMHEQFFGAHTEEVKMFKGQPDLMEASFMDRDMSVVWNGDLHLCLAIEGYQSINGADTETRTKFININLSDWYGLFLDDILAEGYEPALVNAIQQVARRKFEKEPYGAPAEADNAGIIDNYALTNKGIWFVYEPYHFNAFGPEEIKIFVTFEKIANFVKPYWLELAKK